jgi:hypothetical protein
MVARVSRSVWYAASYWAIWSAGGSPSAFAIARTAASTAG